MAITKLPFGKALHKLRIFHELAQVELAQQLKVSKSHVTEIESGKTTPSLNLLERYAQAFEVPVSAIVFFAEHLGGIDREAAIKQLLSPKMVSLMEYLKER
jgi:transcriptional regulator with XRE-family HTH domain